MPVRVLVAVTAIVVLFEALLALAFFVGYYWVGGWEAGLLLCAGLLLMILLPWLGSLEADYDTDGHRVSVRLSWWARLAAQSKPQREVKGRVLGIPWRKKLKTEKVAEQTEEQELEEETRADQDGGWREQFRGMSVEDMTRLAPAALQALADLVWEAQELRLELHAPTGHGLADTVIAAVVGHRGLGPLDLQCTDTGDRRVRVRFRIGMLRAGLAVLYLAIQARPLHLALRSRAAHKEQEQSGQAVAEAEAKESE